MKKILFYLTRYPGCGGIENVTTMITSELCKDYDCTILSHLQQNDFGIDNADVKILHFAEECYDSPENRRYFDKVLTDGVYDLVIYQDSYAPTEKLVVDICRKHDVPFIVFEHNSPLFVENKRSLTPWYSSLKSCLRRLLHPLILQNDKRRKMLLFNAAKRYVLLSESYFKDFSKITGVKNDDTKLVAIHNPILALSTTVSGCSCDDYPTNEILCVCRLVKEKRVELIIDMWARIHEMLPEWRLTIVGDGPKRINLERRAENIPRVYFEGYQNPASYYQRAAIFVMTSKFEGWPMTLVEAMQYGVVPVAMNTFSALTDIIDPGVNGIILSPKESLDSCADKIQALARNPLKLRRMSQKAQEKVRRFEIFKIIEDWKRLIEEVL